MKDGAQKAVVSILRRPVAESCAIYVTVRQEHSGRFNGLFEKLCHGSSLAFPPNPWKGFRGSLLHVIFAQKSP
jgi:hypothetical protein